jgi:branched-chain amino acid transport system substrate-binding protein
VGASVLVMAALLVGLGSTSANASGNPPIPKGPILIGAVYPLSGPYAAYGQSELVGMQGVVDNFNAKGGIMGHKLKFVYMNDQLDPTIAATDAQQLVSEGAKAIFSPGTETEAPADVPIWMKAHIPIIFYNPGDTWGNAKKWPYYYKTGFGTNALSVSLAKYGKHLGITSVGLLSDNTGFGQQSSQDFINAAKANGITVTKSFYYPPTAVSLATQVEALKAAGVPAVFITGGAGYNQAFAEMKALNWTPDILSFASILVLPQFGGLEGTPQAAKAFTECSGYCIPKVGDPLPPQIASLITTMEAKTGTTPNSAEQAIFANDDLAIFKYAVEKAHSVDGPALKKVLDTIHNKSFSVPGYSYTYTPTNHNGINFLIPVASVASGWGQLMNPYLAAGSHYPANVPK